MTEKLSDEKREEIELFIYKAFDAVDKTHSNSEYYKEIFSKMSNDQFYKFICRRLPFRLHISLFKVEPKMSDIFDGFKVLDKPLLEKVKLPYLYENSEGKPIESKEALVGYINPKRMKQMLVEKNTTAIEIDNRDKMGRLMNHDKGGQMTDREFETLAIPGLYHTMDEFSTARADNMKAKAEMYNTINTKGMVSEKDIELDPTASLARNMLNVYMIGAHIHSNLIDEEYMTPLTLKDKKSNAIKRV